MRHQAGSERCIKATGTAFIRSQAQLQALLIPSEAPQDPAPHSSRWALLGSQLSKASYSCILWEGSFTLEDPPWPQMPRLQNRGVWEGILSRHENCNRMEWLRRLLPRGIALGSTAMSTARIIPLPC